MIAALAPPVDDLFVREHGAERGAPIHRYLRLRREPALEQFEEDPLRPFHVTGIRRVHLAGPVVREAQHLQLATKRVDVLRRRDRRVRARVDGVLLRGKPERVPAHRMEYVEAAHALVTSGDVRRDVPDGMTHVETASRRIREHVEHVVLGVAFATLGAKRRVLVPVLLPDALDGAVVVRHFGRLAFRDGGGRRGSCFRGTLPPAARFATAPPAAFGGLAPLARRRCARRSCLDPPRFWGRCLAFEPGAATADCLGIFTGSQLDQLHGLSRFLHEMLVELRELEARLGIVDGFGQRLEVERGARRYLPSPSRSPPRTRSPSGPAPRLDGRRSPPTVRVIQNARARRKVRARPTRSSSWSAARGSP